MLKSKIDQQLSSSPNNGTPGFLSRYGLIEFGGFITTVASLDNRELKMANGVVQLSVRGSIYGIDPQSTLSNDLIMVFGDERDQHEEFVLFDQQFTGDVIFKADIQFQVFQYNYEGTCTINFSNGESSMKPFFIASGGENNFTAIRLKTTKLSNSDVLTTLNDFNYILHK